MRGGSAVVAAVALSLLPLVTAAAVQMRALPAWKGAVAAGRVTEVRVELLSPTATTALLTATTPLSRVEHPLVLNADEPARIAIPVRIDATGIVELSLTGAGPPVLRELALSLRKPGLLVTTRGDEQPPGTLTIGADAFAKLPQAYESVRTVALDAAAFAAMQSAQRAALASFASRCGRIALVGQAPVPARLREAAGCNGRFLVAVQSDSELGAVLDGLGDAAPLPGAAALADLAGGQSWLGSWWSVCLFLVAYCTALSGLAIKRARAGTLLTVSAVAIAASLLLGVRGGLATRASWTVMDSESGTARETVLLRVSGTGRGEVAINLGEPQTLPAAISGNGAVVRLADGENQLIVRQRLFSVADFVFLNTRRRAAPLRLYVQDGRVRLVNADTGTSAAAFLDWRGDVYAVPGLPAGATWEPEQPASAVVQNTAYRLWRRQAALLEASVLLPDGGAGDNAWLMLLPSRGGEL